MEAEVRGFHCKSVPASFETRLSALLRMTDVVDDV